MPLRFLFALKSLIGGEVVDNALFENVGSHARAVAAEILPNCASRPSAEGLMRSWEVGRGKRSDSIRIIQIPLESEG